MQIRMQARVVIRVDGVGVCARPCVSMRVNRGFTCVHTHTHTYTHRHLHVHSFFFFSFSSFFSFSLFFRVTYFSNLVPF